LNLTFQNKIDQTFTLEDKKKLVTIDGRLYNGAWDALSLPSLELDQLAYGAWGTFGNNIGSTLAIAKVLFHLKSLPEEKEYAEKLQKQMLIESIAHDQFLIGWKEAKSKQEGTLYQKLEADIENFPGDFKSYTNYENLEKSYAIINQFINERMESHYAQKYPLKVIPQLWRHFEAQTFLLEENTNPGIGVYELYRQESMTPPYLSGNSHGLPHHLSLEDLLSL